MAETKDPTGSQSDIRPFPIQADSREAPKCTIPWWLAEMAYEAYAASYGRRQSLERIAERGGFGRAELMHLICGRRVSRFRLQRMRRVIAAVLEWWDDDLNRDRKENATLGAEILDYQERVRDHA